MVGFPMPDSPVDRGSEKSMPAARTRKAAARGRRADPKPRHIDGSASWTRIKDRDPSRHYCLVYSGDGAEHGVDYYQSLGYVVEEARAGGPSLTAGVTSQEGQPIQVRGHILMSCSDQRRLEIEQYGPDGDSGQEQADVVEDAIVDRSRGRDHLRGLQGRGLHVDVGTGPEEYTV